VLVEHSDYNRQNLKMRLIAEGILPNKCDRCGAQPEWMGEPLTLVLDHINGVWDDNRRENLRLLCPNCNSQTATFSGRRLKKSGTATSRRKDREGSCCRRCGNPIHPDTKNQLCPTCFASGRRKVERPTKDELSALMGTMTWVRMGEVYGVSDNAVRKWARSYGLLK
jgi:Zn finger protein HypA/HybF involved in hydrogenase expression